MASRQILKVNGAGLHYIVIENKEKINPYTLYRVWWDAGQHRKKIVEYADMTSIFYHLAMSAEVNPVSTQPEREKKKEGRKDMWYAVQKESSDAWDYGSHDKAEAIKMLREQGEGLIAVIDEENNFCLDEIRYGDII